MIDFVLDENRKIREAKVNDYKNLNIVYLGRFNNIDEAIDCSKATNIENTYNP